MKLYLASYRLGEHPEKLKNLVDSTTTNKKIAFITNALDASTNYIKLLHSINRDIRDLEELGFTVEKLDLKEYFGKTAKLKKKLAEFGSMYVRGGNIFTLRRAFKESGLDTVLLEYVKTKKDFVYSGYSAGSCIMTPNFSGLEIVDNPNENPEGYPDLSEKEKKALNNGLGLIKYSLAPHFRSDHPESQKVNQVIEYFMKNKILFKALNDDEVIIKEL